MHKKWRTRRRKERKIHMAHCDSIKQSTQAITTRLGTTLQITKGSTFLEQDPPSTMQVYSPSQGYVINPAHLAAKPTLKERVNSFIICFGAWLKRFFQTRKKQRLCERRMAK